MSDTDSQCSESGGVDPNDVRIGRWSKQEHARFMEAYKMFGKDWRRVAEYVGTRNNVQVRTHAQKSFKKLRRQEMARLKTQRIIAAHRSGLSAAERSRLLEQIELASRAEQNNQYSSSLLGVSSPPLSSVPSSSSIFLPFPKLHFPDANGGGSSFMSNRSMMGSAGAAPLDLASSASSSSLNSPSSSNSPHASPVNIPAPPSLLLGGTSSGAPHQQMLAGNHHVFALNGTIFPRLAALSAISAQQLPLPPAPRVGLPIGNFKFLQDWSVDVK